jgi:hypothetical protein
MWDWLFQFVGPLESAGIPYAIVGSVASSVYGEPRATNDVDLLIQLSRNDAAKLVHAFPSEQFYVPAQKSSRSSSVAPTADTSTSSRWRV